MTFNREGSSRTTSSFLRGLPFRFVVVSSLAVACGGIAKSQADVPSRKEFFLKRDTPVDSVRVATTEAVASASTPAGEADGIAVDAYWAQPIASAQILYRDAADPGESVGVITDAEGHFRLRRLPPRSVLIRASLVGYLPDTVRVDATSGQFVRFALRRQRMRVCGLPVQTEPEIERPFAISVSVRDARTGKAPVVPVTISLRDGKFVDSTTISPSDGPADSILVGAARDRDGVYDVEVTASGYTAWALKRVRPVVSDCDQVVGRVFTAWLLPTN